MNRSVAVILAAVALAAGCTHPLNRTLEQALHEQVISSQRAYREILQPQTMIETTRPESDLDAEMDEKRRRSLDEMSGPTAYDGKPLDLGPDLLGRAGDDAPPTVAMSLRRALHEAVANNLNIQIARLEPAVSQTLVLQAQAVFDAVYFVELSWSKLDTPRPPSTLSDVFGSQQTDTLTGTTGIRKLLETGAQITVQSELVRNQANPSFFALDPYYDANIAVAIAQPLLRNFGSEVNRSQIALSLNAKAESVQRLKQRLLELAQVTEEAYWALVFARQALLIRMELLERTREDKVMIEGRGDYDATPAQVTQARSTYASRQAEVIRSRQDVRRASDALKRLINSPDLSVADETMIVPLDRPADLPIQFSLLDAVSTALEHRPELIEALLEIEDASIRQRVADNQRLPELTVTATVQYTGVGGNTSRGYEQVTDGDFIDYLIQGQFELPLGNRQREAAFRQRQLEHRASVINYQRQAQDVVVEVKDALRELVVNYQLVGAERKARLAAADNVRAINELVKAGERLTPEFLDLKLSRELALALAEQREYQALIDYNNAVTNFYRTMGTLLERNGIDFVEQP